MSRGAGRWDNSATVSEMRKAAAWNVMGIERSTQAAAEEAARRAGMTVAEWLDEVVAEQAAGQGVANRDIEPAPAREARPEPPSRGVRAREPSYELRARERERDEELPRPRAERVREPSDDFRTRERERDRDNERPRVREPEMPPARDPAQERLEAAIARLEANASRREEQTAKALESVAEWMERSEGERARAPKPRLPAESAAVALEPPRLEREAFVRAEPEAARPAARQRVDLNDAIERIQLRRGELDARQGIKPAMPRPARRDVEPPPQSTRDPAVDVLRAEIGELNARLERIREQQRQRATARPKAELETADRNLTPGEAELAAGRTHRHAAQPQ